MTTDNESVDAEAFGLLLEDLKKGPQDFPQDGRVLFRIEERDGGDRYLATSPNTPFVAFVIAGHKQQGMEYGDFLTLCGELLRKNGAPAGAIQSFTPWREAAATGEGFVQFAID